jgi:hypothetical protein
LGDEVVSRESNEENNESEKEDNMIVTHDYNLRGNRERDYSHHFAFLSVSAGLKSWGDGAKEALMDE